MMYMNEWDIEEALTRYRHHDILGPATRTLSNLRHATNRCSDGWAYWPKPCRAARQLMLLIEGDRATSWRDPVRADVTAAAYRKACTPLKSLRTRYPQLVFDIEEAR